MTDLIPNDLSHMSDEDFNALCPQGHHAPGPEPLSPAALSVWCRFCEVVEEHGPPRLGLAAALRAAADQVVPSEQSTHRPDGPLVTGDMLWDDATAATLRFRLLTIAAELEGADG